jgi:hypothetical protein
VGLTISKRCRLACELPFASPLGKPWPASRIVLLTKVSLCRASSLDTICASEEKMSTSPHLRRRWQDKCLDGFFLAMILFSVAGLIYRFTHP